MAKLYILSGPDLGRSVEISPGTLLGRSPACAVHLRHTSVSREHARLDLLEGRWTIVDLSSRNGIMLRGERVTTAVLDDGDEFRVGDLLLRFRSVVDAPSPAADRSEPTNDGGLVLEGDWDKKTLNLAATEVARMQAFTAPRATAPPDATPLDARIDRRPPAAREPFVARTGTPSARSGVTVASERGILQYQRVQERSGLFGSDVGQQPLFLRVCIVLLALAAFVFVFWAAYRGTVFLKEKAHGDTPSVNQESER